MNVSQWHYSAKTGWKTIREETHQSPVRLVLFFGDRFLLDQTETIQAFMNDFSGACYVSVSTAGEIMETEVFDETITATAISFDKTPIQCKSVSISDFADSFEAGKAVMSQLPKENLTHVLVFSDGHSVNGTYLVRGMETEVPATVSITGGLAGDGSRFEKTLVGLNSVASPGTIALIGFYGDAIQVGLGCQGGWDPFGPEREITKATDNVLYELDHQSALDLYKKYLGEQAQHLPGSALLFPLAIKTDATTPSIMRTILSINEEEKSMIFAGNMPVGARAQLMKANFDRLIDGAGSAADASLQPLKNAEPQLAILISCVGRKLILNQRTDEEVEAVAESLGGNPAITGFYSYGEIAPFFGEVKCELHNQTMTITTISEKKM